MKQQCCRKLLLAIQAVSAAGDHGMKQTAYILLGVFFFFFHSGRVNPHTSEGKDVRKKIASLLHKITVIPKAEPCPVSLGSVCPRINRMPEPRQSCGDRENEINQMFSTDAPAWMSCVPQG